jgi:hypothetical protein
MLAISDSVILSWCFYISPSNITCSVFIDYQVDSLVSEEYVPEGVFLVVLTTPTRWLNIGLDINRVLCHCIEKVGTSRMPFVYDVRQGIHSSTVPTIVGPKAIFTRPDLLEFLTEISKFAARIFIWSSMKRSTVDKIVDYLFRGLPLPFDILGHDILGQDSCRKIKTSQGKYLTVIGGSKEFFLKNLSKALFVGSTLLDEENTILIDDSPEKCVCNDRGNCLFLKTWTPLDSSDDFLIRTFAPWLLQLHGNCSHGQLRDFVNSNRIGVPPLAADSKELLHIANGMAFSSKNVHANYKVLGVPGFVIPKTK